ncbi:hypothetical protein LPJ55_002978 [Coemansia sp. RSA 990]|nr:hypothetical protein LPJ79_000636 [Coemansia sp. RSA 1821]KAJ1872591.1 hypothetical protein LPJ55_002978 [Coemansia sp. RSA 990]
MPTILQSLKSTPLQTSELVAPVEIYTGTIPDNAELIAVGWSIQAKDNKSSANDLKAAKLRVGGRIECSTYDALYTGANSPRICTLSKSAPDNATCKGDLGSGALTVVDGKLYLVGVDSHPNDSACGGSAGYTQFTNVNNYQSFISQYLN